MNKQMKKLISFVTRKSSSSLDYKETTNIAETTTTTTLNTCDNDGGGSTPNLDSELILNPANLKSSSKEPPPPPPPSSSSSSSMIRTNSGVKRAEIIEVQNKDSVQKVQTHNAHRKQSDVVIASSSSLLSLPSPQCDVTTSNGSDSRGVGDGAVYYNSKTTMGSDRKFSSESSTSNPKDFQVVCFDDETPRLSDEVELTEDQKAELKQAFSMFEKTGKGRIQARDLGELLRCLGWNPSEQDLEEARHELELSTRGTISFSEVEAYIARRGGIYYGNNAEEDIMVAFQVLDKTGSGKITVSDFRHFMTTMGERMSSEEVEELIECSTRGGKDYIEYRDLVHAVQQSPT